MKDKEAIYDEKISPLMKQILEVCEEHGMPMFATFQFSDYGFCTSAMEHDGHHVIRFHRALAQCGEGERVNIDKFMFWVAKEAKGKSHSSIVLKQMGVPCEPEETSAV